MPNKPKTLKMRRSQWHEYSIADTLISLSGRQAHWNPAQTLKKNEYARQANDLSTTDRTKIRQAAVTAASKLPRAAGNVTFVERCANNGTVWDITYTDTDTGEPVYVSCKLSHMENKAYRFNTKDYMLSSVQQPLRLLFCDGKGNPKANNGTPVTFYDALVKARVTKRDLFDGILNDIKTIATDAKGFPADYAVFCALVRERFLGQRNYWETDQHGNAVHYPNIDNVNAYVPVIDSFLIKGNSVIFNVAPVTGSGTVFRIAMRVKFKDGVNKPITANSNGVGNLGATVNVTVI